MTPVAEKVPAAQLTTVAFAAAVQGDVTRLPALVCVQGTHTLPFEYVPPLPPVHASQTVPFQPKPDAQMQLRKSPVALPVYPAVTGHGAQSVPDVFALY